MGRTLKMTRLALLCAGLMACSPFGWRAAFDSGAQAEQTYRTGRAQHLAQQTDAARAAYEAVLRLEPGHPGARNGLATLHAESRYLERAIAIWRELTASIGLDAGPGKAYLFANLGQAYLLNGEHGQARGALERACLLDPLNPRAWQLLGDALAGSGQAERAAQMHRQAAALRQHDLRADFAAAGGKTGVAPLGQALAAPKPQAHPDWSQSYIHVGVDGMMELRRVEGARLAHEAREAPAPAAVARLEIRNGNGVTGMARALSNRIDEPGIRVTRLSNEPGFAVSHTRIEYEASHADAARRLAQRLGSTQLREVDPGAPVNLRLVLGRDQARHGTALRLAPPAPAADQQLAYR
ncbi:LytR C-terminal domain-containing protein [Massilia sp. CFBP9012]|uniref:LytR C-terminal domain-containing protein n=1 Tax=Massilia sp. CFBP9012 TaxID=3096531 RepID=UPI002A6B5D44|nr:LytR C-terminal domain-containing protein [Massilia sp. CFBP9012]MDY0974444.1 LytR C-terminal domain-containing protein [Massilia sp. CFBP9012]